MPLARRKLPIGVQTFAKIRAEDYYYVDKTPFAYRLIESGKYYFLSRPRRLDLLLAHDLAGLKDLFQAFFATIPHQWYDNNPISRYEGYYASVFYSYFAALGLDFVLEDATNQGRIDMTVKFNGRIYLFEFKVVELMPEGRALQQLQSKDYAEQYPALGQPIHLIGVEFSRASRNVVGFEIG